MRLQIERGVRDEDRAVVGSDLALIRGAGFPGVLPAGGRRLHDLGVVHQDIRTVHVGHAVVMAVDGVVPRRLERLDHVFEIRDQVDVDLGHVAVGDQPVGCVTAGGNAVPLGASPLPHQRHHLVGRVRELDVDLAASLGRERSDPVHLGVRLAAFDVACPRHQIQCTFTWTDAGRQIRRRLGRRGTPARRQHQCGCRRRDDVAVKSLHPSSSFF